MKLINKKIYEKKINYDIDNIQYELKEKKLNHYENLNYNELIKMINIILLENNNKYIFDLKENNLKINYNEIEYTINIYYNYRNENNFNKIILKLNNQYFYKFKHNYKKDLLKDLINYLNFLLENV